MSRQWTAADVPDQWGRTAVVTGANTGIGFEAAKVLAEHAATVVLACRDLDKADRAAARIGAAAPDARVATLRLDLASLASVREAAEQLRSRYARLDLLVNNAGIMMPPYGRTADGFESQFGTNHLGHFALTGLLLDTLVATPDSRIVTVSSNGHRAGDLVLDDLNWERRRYRRTRAYAQSKLANLMFTYELQRRLAAAGATAIAVAAHPGTAYTELGRYAAPPVRVVMNPRARRLFSWFMQSAPMGALPTVRAAVDPDVRGGDYYGPDGRFGSIGYPTRVESSDRSHDVDAQRRLWAESERLTEVPYRLGGTAPSADRTAG